MIRWFILLYSLVLFILFLALFFRPITAINEDLGRHLLLGNIIVATHTVPATNLLSFIYPNFPFINSSWLSGVLFYFVYKIGGFNLLQIVSLVTVFFAFFLQLKFVRERFSKASIILVSTLYLLLLIPRTDIRPEIFSMLFISIFISFLFEFIENPSKKIFLLIPLEILWVNMHIYFVIGPVLVLLFLIQSFLGKQKLNVSKRLAAVFFGTVFASFINPNGIYGALFPFLVFRNYGFPVTENQSIISLFKFFNSGALLFPVFVIISAFLISLLAIKKTKPIDWLLLIIFSVLSLINFRNIILFVFITFISQVSQVSYLFKKYSKKIIALPRVTFTMIYPFGILILLALIIKTTSVRGFGFGLRDYGRGSVDFLLKNNIKGYLYNDFNIGGYLSYRIYPEKIFIDNRPEAYPKEFFTDTYLPLQRNPEIFEGLNNKYKFNAIIVSHWDASAFENKLLQYFVSSPNFSLVYLDDYAMILVRNSSKNQKLIEKYRLSKQSMKFGHINDSVTLVHYLFFFEKIKWDDKAREVLLRLKIIDPNLCSLNNYPLLRKSNFSFPIKRENCGMFQ